MFTYRYIKHNTWRTPFKGNLIINTYIHTIIQYSTLHYSTLHCITYIHTYTYIHLNMYIYNYIHTDMTDVCGASSSSVCSSRSLRAATCSSGSWTSCTCCMHRQGGEPRGMLTKHHLKVDKVSSVFQRYQSLSNFGLLSSGVANLWGVSAEAHAGDPWL